MRLLRRSREQLIERPEAYLFRIAANLAYEQRLNGTITADFDGLEAAGEFADESMAPERRAIGQERLRRLEQALDDLPPLPRAAFALQRRDELSYAVQYPDETHIKWQPAHRASVYERNVDWLNFWLRGVEDSTPKKADQYERWRNLMELREIDSANDAQASE